MADEGAIKGVAVLRYPVRNQIGDRTAREVATLIADNIKVGGVICFPNTRDAHGEYEWDFRIEPATEEQLQVVHMECDKPHIVEVIE